MPPSDVRSQPEVSTGELAVPTEAQPDRDLLPLGLSFVRLSQPCGALASLPSPCDASATLFPARASRGSFFLAVRWCPPLRV
jgi:hypothetical protein